MLGFAPMANGARRAADRLRSYFSLFPFLFSLCGAAAQPAAAASAAENYLTYCALCHLPGIHGAPKVGEREDWARRVRPGMTMVFRNAVEGMPNTAMLPLGGAPLTAAQVRAIVDYMVAAAGLPASALKDAARYEKLGIASHDFIRRDANYDGYLTRNELAGDHALLAAFARFDGNRDGRLDEAEYLKAEAALERERAAVQVDDAALEAAVRAALAKVKGVDLRNAKLGVNAGVVSVIGIVEHASIAVAANDALKRIPGVKKIDNRLVSGEQIGWD